MSKGTTLSGTSHGLSGMLKRVHLSVNLNMDLKSVAGEAMNGLSWQSQYEGQHLAQDRWFEFNYCNISIFERRLSQFKGCYFYERWMNSLVTHTKPQLKLQKKVTQNNVNKHYNYGGVLLCSMSIQYGKLSLTSRLSQQRFAILLVVVFWWLSYHYFWKLLCCYFHTFQVSVWTLSVTSMKHIFVKVSKWLRLHYQRINH